MLLAAHVNPTWAATRATGVVSLVLLTATLVLGIAAAAGLKTAGWPRFVSQDLHRNLSLLCLGLIAIHVVTTVLDGYVPIRYLDAVIPFGSSYRTVYVGLGAVAFDLFIALLITSALRHRIGFAGWHTVHWAAYLCWPLALVHALGTGTDTRLRLVTAIEAACAIAVVLTSLWWLVARRDLTASVRTAGGAAAVAAALAIAIFALLGPLKPGWSKRAAPPPSPVAHVPARGTVAARAGAPFVVGVSGVSRLSGVSGVVVTGVPR